MAAYDVYPASTVTSTATASAGAGLAAAPGASQAPPPLDDTGAPTTRADRHPLPQGRTPRHFSAAPLVLVDLLVPALLLVTGSGRALAAVSLALGTTLVHRWLGLYRRRLTENALDDLPYLAVGVLVGASAVAVIAEVVDPLELRHLWAVALVMLACIVLGRSQVYAHHRRQRRRPGGQVRLLVVGEGEAAQELGRRVANNRDQGIELVGYVGSHRTREDATLTPLGSLTDLGRTVEEQAVTAVVLALPDLREHELARVIRRDLPRRVEVYSLPVGFSIRRWTMPLVDHVWGMPIFPITPTPTVGPAWRVKRAFDLVVATLSLVLLSPLLAAVALAVRRESGQVIFRQERIGRDGQPFTLLKFTSLRPVDSVESGTVWNIADDDRLGPVGRFIRATSIDELPQLVNVLRGDMSIVGPRPERPFFVDRYSQEHPHYVDRHRAPVGLTGYAAVHGLRGDTSISDRASFDNYYIDNWSLWLDVKIIVRTVGSVVRRQGG